ASLAAPASHVHEPPPTATSRGFRAKQAIRRKVTRKSPPLSKPPSQSDAEGPSAETLSAASASTPKKFRFMQTPGLPKQN
ncbi:hypothetical protein PIB30_114621, partial [Stylosanthes scabra]|nr:hypothetical protein [Stylosanthes scabra]